MSCRRALAMPSGTSRRRTSNALATPASAIRRKSKSHHAREPRKPTESSDSGADGKTNSVDALTAGSCIRALPIQTRLSPGAPNP